MDELEQVKRDIAQAKEDLERAKALIRFALGCFMGGMMNSVAVYLSEIVPATSRDKRSTCSPSSSR
eukprot:scaffold7194_cov181-Ochromonas_danica.AAC.3